MGGIRTGRGAALHVVLMLLEQQAQPRFGDSNVVQKHREGRTTHQSGQGFPKSRKTRRKTGLWDLNIPKGPVCLCIAVLFCSGSKLQSKHSGHSQPLTTSLPTGCTSSRLCWLSTRALMSCCFPSLSGLSTFLVNYKQLQR